MRQKAHGIWACAIFLSRPVSLTARMENKNRRSGKRMEFRDERSRYHCLNGRELS